MRPRRVPADPLEQDFEIVFGRHQRSAAGLKAADRQPRQVVETINLFKRKAFEQPIVQHRQCALAPFLGRLEEEVDRRRRNLRFPP